MTASDGDRIAYLAGEAVESLRSDDRAALDALRAQLSSPATWEEPPADLEDRPANADVVGGALVAGKPAVPWSIFRQLTTPPGTTTDQIFSRSFAGGAWTTRGAGTVNGRSSASPTFLGSLNFDQGQDGEAPAIDFAGTGRTVPWATWYENTSGTGFGNNNIFASRFDNTGDANQGKWIFSGQSRGNGAGLLGCQQIPDQSDLQARSHNKPYRSLIVKTGSSI